MKGLKRKIEHERSMLTQCERGVEFSQVPRDVHWNWYIHSPGLLVLLDQ